MLVHVKGMNTDVVRRLALEIESSAGELRAVDAAVHRVLSDLAAQWQGGDFERFKGWWENEHRPALQRLAVSVDGLARSARHNADEQDRVSSASGSSGPQSNASVQQRIDYGRVAVALVAVQAALHAGGLGVRSGELFAIDEAFRGLDSDAERALLFEELTDDEVAILKDQMQESRAKGGFTSEQQAFFLGMLLPSLTIKQAQELMGPYWAWTWDGPRDPVPPAQSPSDLTAGLIEVLGEESRISPDEIEIRKLDDGSYIVLLPGVQDLRDGLQQGAAGAKAGATLGLEGAAAGTAVGVYASWEGRNATDSARDMHYARQSEMQSDNGSANGTNAYAFAVKEVMRVSGIPDGADVMLVGHSFGAYTAVEMATDPLFNEAMGGGQGNYSVNITHVAAAGASVAFRMDDLPPGTEGVLLNNSRDAAYLGERAVPTNNATSAREIVFNGGLDGAGHQPSNYGAFVRSVNLDELNEFNQSALDRYGGSGEAFRVTVKDPYR
jgi:uncharacterized protein YukE